MVSQHLPFVMGEVFNRPHLISESHAAMIAAVLAGKMNITALATDFGELDDRGLEDLASMGRMEARQRQAAKRTDHTGMAKFEGRGYPYDMSDSGIAVLPVMGTLKRTWGVGPFSGATGYDGLWTQFMHACDNSDVKAIWMPHNTGGGAVDGLEELGQTIFENSARFGGKPVWAMAADHTASAGYWLAAAADKVFMPRLGTVGSIGAVILHAEMSKALEDEGIKVTIFRSKDGKMRGNAMEALDEATSDMFQSMVDEVDQVFVERVAEYRKVSKKSIHETNASVYMGRQALATGLCNDILSEPEAWMKLEQLVARK